LQRKVNRQGNRDAGEGGARKTFRDLRGTLREPEPGRGRKSASELQKEKNLKNFKNSGAGGRSDPKETLRRGDFWQKPSSGELVGEGPSFVSRLAFGEGED